ncbi:hypothetical protein Tco_0563457 [Tanacetum coccineum]
MDRLGGRYVLGLKAFLMLLVLLLLISELILLSCYKVNAAEGVNAASEEVSTAELVSTAYLKEFDLLKWDQQVVSELVALRNFARRYGSRFYTHGGCIQSSHAQTGCTLMMGIPNEHQLKFNSIKDAKQLLEAIEKLVSQLELLDEKLSQEDVNQKLLRSLSHEWEHTMLLCGRYKG